MTEYDAEEYMPPEHPYTTRVCARCGCHYAGRIECPMCPPPVDYSRRAALAGLLVLLLLAVALATGLAVVGWLVG